MLPSREVSLPHRKLALLATPEKSSSQSLRCQLELRLLLFVVLLRLQFPNAKALLPLYPARELPLPLTLKPASTAVRRVTGPRTASLKAVSTSWNPPKRKMRGMLVVTWMASISKLSLVLWRSSRETSPLEGRLLLKHLYRY